MIVGVLHPGAMGSALGALARGTVLWAGEGRSAATRERAEAAGFDDTGTLADLVPRSDVIFSVCPPGAALAQAGAVADLGFDGIYVDANAVSPATVREIGSHFERFVDGGIVGPSPTSPGATRLYLCGPEAPKVGELFDSPFLEVRRVDGAIGAASAVKVCFAAWTKGSAALLLSIRALASAEGVEDDILGEWLTSIPELPGRSEAIAARSGLKAWRFAGEMEEISAAFAADGLPDGFHAAAAEVFRRLASLKGASPEPTIEDVVALLLPPPPSEDGRDE